MGAVIMSQPAGTAESEIKALIEAWADAVRRHDLPAILAYHDEDIVMFDVPPPLQSRVLAEYRKTWDLFFAHHQPGQAFDVEELQMCVGDTVAFAVAIMRCGSATVGGSPVPGGFQFRLTIGLCKANGAWRIRHTTRCRQQTRRIGGAAASGRHLRRRVELLVRPAIPGGKETA
jgi:ketosteroid isomerase-like protein